MNKNFKYKTPIPKAVCLLLFLCSFIFHTKVKADLVDELLEYQRREAELQLDTIESAKKNLSKNCKLPFKNQRQLIEDLSTYINVNPMTIKIVSAEIWGVDDKLYCRANIYHEKGLCKVTVNFDTSGALTSSLQKLRIGQCEF